MDFVISSHFHRLASYTAAASYVTLLWGGPISASATLLLSLATVWAGWRSRSLGSIPAALVASLGALALFQAFAGFAGAPMAVLDQVAHLATAMLFFAVLLTLAVASAETGHRMRGPVVTTAQWLLPLGAAATVYLTAVTGGVTRVVGVDACAGWPLCGGQGLLALAGPAAVHMMHRLSALLAGVLVVATGLAVWRSHRHRPWLQGLAVAAAALFLMVTALGAASLRAGTPSPWALATLAATAALLALLVVLTVRLVRVPPLAPIAGGESAAPAITAAPAAPVAPAAGAVLPVVRDYIMLMKPRIILLLLITTYAAMWVASGGPPPLGIALATLIGGTLSSGAANALNMYLDRDIDAVMGRTRRRPVPSGRLGPEQALHFGIATGLISCVVLAVLVNLLSAVLATAGLLFYVFVYTRWLKRTTAQNIVIGGAAGAVPPLVGWAAITGRVDLAAVVMFMIVFLWTPPHFWALALFRKEDYAAAGVPMLPVVRGERYTKWQILGYAVLTVLCTLALVPLQVVGRGYLLIAALAGAYFIWTCVALLRDRSGTMRTAHVVFGYSILYLGVIFLAMVLDARGVA